MEEVVQSPNKLASVDAPIRAQLLKELPKSQRDSVVANLVESAMIMGLNDAFEIRTWLGLSRLDIRTISNLRDKVKQRWFEESGDIVEYARTQRAVQIKRAWDNIRKCEDMFLDSKSVGDKVKVKQLELQYMQYIARLSFIDQMVESGTPDTQVNVVAWSNLDRKEND